MRKQAIKNKNCKFMLKKERLGDLKKMEYWNF